MIFTKPDASYGALVSEVKIGLLRVQRLTGTPGIARKARAKALL